MSLHVLANHMATKGRGSDSMLVHMTPEEVASLQALAMKNGGSLTINPDTGLPEAGFLKKLLPALAGFALNAFLPGVGTAIGGALGLGGAAGSAIAVGGITSLATGSLSKGLMAGLGAYGGAGLAEGLVGAGTASGLNNTLASAGTAEGAQGQAFNEFLKSDANPAVMSSTDKLSAGFNAVKEAPGAFLKDNWKYGLAAASPFLADAMVPTATKMPAATPGYIRPYQYDANTRTVKAMDPVLASEWGARQFPDFIRKGQTAPPAGMAPQTPPGMARGGIVALADGGETDPYAKYNTLSGQSKAAYDYLMGSAPSSGTAPLPPARPIVTTPVTPPAGSGGGGESSPINTIVEPPVGIPALLEPVTTTPTDSYDQDAQDAIDKYEQELADEQYDQENQDAIDRVEENIFNENSQDAITRLEESMREEALAESARASDIDDATISTDPVYVADDGTTDSIEDTIRQITPVPETPEELLNRDEWGDLQAAIDTNTNIDASAAALEREALARENPWGNLDDAIAANNLSDSARASAIDDATIAVDNYGTYSGFTPAPADQNIPVVDMTPSPSADMRSSLAAGVDPITGVATNNGAAEEAARALEAAQREEAERLHEAMNWDSRESYNTPSYRDVGGYCPAPWINILLADGGTVKAGDIKPGMEVYTRHETTNEWGVYPVSDVEMSEGNRWEVLLEDGRSFVGSFNHRVHTGDGWTKIRFLKAGDKLVQPEGFGVVKSSTELDYGPVVRITVADAHTYVSEGFLSHNVKKLDSNFNDFDYSDYDSYDWNGWANGGMVPGYALGGLGSLGGYSDGGRLLKGPGDGVSDSIPATIGNKKQPARLADGEFVVPARIVSELGNGSTEAGARKLYAMMDRIQKARGKTVGKGKVAANSRSDKHLPA